LRSPPSRTCVPAPEGGTARRRRREKSRREVLRIHKSSVGFSGLSGRLRSADVQPTRTVAALAAERSLHRQNRFSIRVPPHAPFDPIDVAKGTPPFGRCVRRCRADAGDRSHWPVEVNHRRVCQTAPPWARDTSAAIAGPMARSAEIAYSGRWAYRPSRRAATRCSNPAGAFSTRSSTLTDGNEVRRRFEAFDGRVSPTNAGIAHRVGRKAFSIFAWQAVATVSPTYWISV